MPRTLLSASCRLFRISTNRSMGQREIALNLSGHLWEELDEKGHDYLHCRGE